MHWRLYYDDRTTYSSDDGSWLEAPAWGVMAVAVPDPYVGRVIDRARNVGAGDFYVWLPKARVPWWVDHAGLFDMLIRRGVMTVDQTLADITPATMIAAGVKFGRSVDNVDWRDLADWIVADADETFGGVDGDRPAPPPLSG